MSDSIDNLPKGIISLIARITTDDQAGTFFLDYIISDRIENFGNYVVHNGPYPISVDAPMGVTVDNTNDNGQGTLRQALSEVSSTGEILFDLTYPATIQLDSELVVDRNLTITGPESGELVISGNHQTRIFSISNLKNVTISNLTISEGSTNDKGSGIYCDNSGLNLKKVRITQNISNNEDGGAIYCRKSNLILSNTAIAMNTARNGAAIYGGEDSYINLINCTISNNKTSEGVGGIYLDINSSVDMINSIFSYNEMPELGFPNLEDPTASFTVTNSIFNVNTIVGGAFTLNELNNVYSDTDPMFADTTNGDYRLQPGSVCIDKGIQDTVIVYNEGQDTLFVPPMSFIGLAPDMGAYEFDPSTNIENSLNNPATFKLNQNYPNPFNPTTTIEFTIPKTEFVTLKIYNLLGQEVEKLLSKKLTAGEYSFNWNAGDLSSGLYIYRLEAGDFNEIKKMVLLK